MKEYIPHEQALELKELGCTDFQFSYTGISISYLILWQQAFRFFREKFNFHYFIERDGDVYNAVCDAYLIVVCNTYEQAEHACLLKLIELAKQKQ